MPTTTKTVAINAAFLQEIKDDHRELRQLLDESATLLAASPQGGGRRELVQLLNRLRDQLATHFALEEAYGYCEDAIHQAPWLSSKAEALRAEHRTLFTDMCAVVDEAEKLMDHEPPHPHLEDVARIFQGFHDRFLDHENREVDLILAAFGDDVGVGD